MNDSSPFIEGHLRTLDKPVHRLGLSFNFGISPAGVEEAVERGVNYLFWTTARTGHALPAVKAALARDRERMILAGGPSIAYFRGNIRRGTERLLKKLGTEYLPRTPEPNATSSHILSDDNPMWLPTPQPAGANS